MVDASSLRPRFELWLARENMKAANKEGIEILKAVRDCGSFNEAAKHLGISYRHLWKSLTAMEDATGEALVESRIGGHGGGGTTLTIFAETMIQDFEYLNERMTRTAEHEYSRSADLSIIGSNCIGIDVIVSLLKKKEPNAKVRNVSVGSERGLQYLIDGISDVSGIHILDKVTSTYNIPYTRQRGLADRVILIRGYTRKQGLIIERGNPKRIRGWTDLLRKDVSMINRNQGSGTRILIDHNLARLANSMNLGFSELSHTIKGYDKEARSHAEAALSVSRNESDVAIGIMPAAKRHNLTFIRVADEHFDFAIRKQDVKKQIISSFIAVLRSQQFRRELGEKAPGLIPSRNTGQIIRIKA